MARSIALEWRNEEPRDQGQSRDLPKTDAEKRVELGMARDGKEGEKEKEKERQKQKP